MLVFVGIFFSTIGMSFFRNLILFQIAYQMNCSGDSFKLNRLVLGFVELKN